MTTDARQQPTSPLAYRVIATVAIFAGLYFARDLLIPIALAIFLAFLLAPLVRRIQGWGLRRGLAVFVLVALTFSLINFASCFVGARAMSLVEQLPKYRENIVIKARSLRASVGETLQPVSQTIDAVIQEIAAPVPPEASNRAVLANGNGVPERDSAERTIGGGVPTTAPTIVVPAESTNGMTRLFKTMLVPLLNPILTFALSAVFAVFFLIYREDLRDRIIGVLGDGHIGVTTTALSEAGERVSRYFGGLMMTNCLNGAAIAVGLLVLGVPDAIVFGVVAAVLRFVPFLGPWMAAAFPTALSLAFFQGWTIPVLVVALFVAVDQFSANVMEPLFYGTRTGASPTAIILSMIVWTWLWGAIGLLLATPITVCLVVLGKYVSRFRNLYILLGDQPVFQPHVRLYQRLLAMDRKEAAEIVENSVQSGTPESAFSEVVVPALSLVAGECRNDSLSPTRESVVREIIETQLARLPPSESDAAPDSSACPSAMLISAHGPNDELCAPILARLFESRGGTAFQASPHLLVSELLDQIRSEAPMAICLFSVCVDSISKIELLSRRITDLRPDITIVVGIWDPAARASRLQRRFARFQQVRISTTVAGSLRELGNCLQMTKEVPSKEGDDRDRRRHPSGGRTTWRRKGPWTLAHRGATK